MAALAFFLQPTPAQEPAVPAEPLQASGEITITRQHFGVNNVCRPGEWTGIQLRINDSNDKPREVLIRIPTPDADGDKPGWEASLTTNPGVSQPVWAYLHLPATFKPGTPLKAYVYAAVEAPGGAAGDSPVTTGRMLGSAYIQAQRVVSSAEGMLGIVGNRTMGLGRYAGNPTESQTFLINGHERWEIVPRLDADSLPDRWQGLMQFAALVWNEPTPGSLNSEKSAAIREWVLRGGHLIVVLPRLAQTWTDEASNPLFDLVPRVRVNRYEGASLEPIRTLITRLPKNPPENRPLDSSLDMPVNEVLQTFTPLPGASAQDAACIMAMPKPADGSEPEWLVVRRRSGLGMVTLIGLDAASRWMDQKALPDPELFWHRILGRRGQLTPIKDDPSRGNFGGFGRSPSTIDNGISDHIAKTTLAGAGVLMGLVVFVLYWLVAGPLGYAALKKTGRQRHAWVGFVLAAGLFTGIAWGGATIIRPAKVSAAHITVLDHVYTPEGQNVQRARSWMSVLIPQYGEATVAIGDPTKKDSERFHNLLTPWERDNQSSAGFPDARGYRINSRNPDHFAIPTRSTVKVFQADWAGGPVWKMPHPVPDASGKPTEITADPIMGSGTEVTGVKLAGTLVHDLPEALRHVTVIVNLGQRPLNTSFAGAAAWRLTSDVFAVSYPNPWEPGTPLDLGKEFPSSVFDVNSKEKWFGRLVTDLARNSADGLDGQSRKSLTITIQKMDALAMFGALEPPQTEESAQSNNLGRPLVRRQATHGLDLSPWLTQPCIIILGHVGGEDQGPNPVPLMVSSGGSYRAVPMTGPTFIRWVYPLPPRPPAFKSGGDDSPSPPDPT